MSLNPKSSSIWLIWHFQYINSVLSLSLSVTHCCHSFRHHITILYKKKKHFSIQLFSSQRQYFPANSPLHYFTKWAGQLMEINLVSLENSWDKENIDKLLSRKIISTYIFTISTYFSTFCQSDST